MRSKNFLSKIQRFTLSGVLFLFSFFAVLPLYQVYAQTVPTQAQLEQQLKDVEKEIAEYQKQLAVTTSQKKTLTNKINQLKIKQKELNALIRQTSLKIDKLTGTITVTKRDLDAAIVKEAAVQGQMGEVLRAIHEQETRLLFLLASGNGLSSSFVQIKHFAKLSGDLSMLINQVRDLKAQIASKKFRLEDQKEDAQNLLRIKSIQNQSLAGSLKEQNTLLTETKGKEADYQTVLADKKKQAAQIRSRIYELFNTGSTVNFGQAVDIAKLGSGLTGVRPAFLLAILTQESNLGKNVGTCNRVGDPPENGWRTIMKPERDQDHFLQITKELGLNPDTTPVSCPMRNKDGSRLGWGGAMGPAQFIPSTWMGYKDKVAGLTGKSPANPWDIRDAFVAAGVKLKSNGADGTEAGEWKAAMIYFSGSTNARYRFYGDNVMATAKKYQADIDELNS